MKIEVAAFHPGCNLLPHMSTAGRTSAPVFLHEELSLAYNNSFTELSLSRCVWIVI